MTDTTKTLIASFFGMLALVAIFAIMADCSKAVSRTSSEAVEACVKTGGTWIGSNDGIAPNLDLCSYPEKQK